MPIQISNKVCCFLKLTHFQFFTSLSCPVLEADLIFDILPLDPVSLGIEASAPKNNDLRFCKFMPEDWKYKKV
jgi:hypothetical protein